MDRSLTIRDANEKDIALVREIAYKVWPGTYSKILPAGQVEYMLDLIYSIESLKHQIQHLNHRFLILEEDGHGVGFASYADLGEHLYKLNKLYVLITLQRKGAGSMLLKRVLKNIKQENAEALILTVNRDNLPAKHFYEKQGFVVSGEEKTDIGTGYFMDDYIMKLELGYSTDLDISS